MLFQQSIYALWTSSVCFNLWCVSPLFVIQNSVCFWNYVIFHTFKPSIKYFPTNKCCQVSLLSLFGKHSLDWISLDLFTWSKVSVKFGVWSNALFCHLIKIFINELFYVLIWSNYFTCFHLIESSNNDILGF